ncbi:PIG-L family deacetylase [Cryobacterium sp. CG_9.6]|uniref:PIG-L family deacetylase n=1 Tax=Cryobacterium sp. CG_9.6 TaxID=2760710 RepID=UPI002473F82F|nr:PIG-L family deacetylase [Cryobacterium sp. CG_9.6]MDH6237581.1 N-acetyl-1-D-myo-inositol-2-amino-2-deoxy-alpha-D-glucopyranoside deacetylase [Cryobacterium sp. CG_9.6]
MSILDTVTSVLLVHAHPDDETITTGALIAELVARGIRVFLLTATRGERGEVVAGPLSALEGTDALSREREHELDGATRALGLNERFWLGEAPARATGLAPRRYQDSGMTWIRPGLAGPALDSDDTALVRAPLSEVTADLSALLIHLRPSLVISYDDGGGYGHPDHVRMHRVTRTAARATDVPFAEIVPDRTRAAEWFDLDQHHATVAAALRCHASQLTVHGSHIVHSGGQREAIITSVGLSLVEQQATSPTTAADP